MKLNSEDTKFLKELISSDAHRAEMLVIEATSKSGVDSDHYRFQREFADKVKALNEKITSRSIELTDDDDDCADEPPSSAKAEGFRRRGLR